MRVLKQSTAVTVLLGPFLDKTDGVTEETGLASTGTELSKAGGTFAAGPTLGTHDSDGWYPISLTTTHTNTLGDLTIKVHDAATHLPVWAHFTVLPANQYDGMVSGTGVGGRADVQGWLGVAPAAVTVGGVPEVDITHIAGSAVSTSTAQLGVNVVNAAGTAWASGAITAAVFASDAITAAKVAADVSAEIADAVWDEDATAHQTTGTFGQAIGDPVADTNTIYAAVVTNAAGATIAADIISIQADTDDIQTRLPAALISGRMDSNAQVVADKTGYSIGTGGIAAAAFAAGAIDAAAIAADAIGSSELAATAATEIADAVLDRDMSTGTDSGSSTVRTPRQALRALRNKASISAGTLTVTKEDDATASWTAAVTTTAGNPISEIDPAGP